MAAEVARSERAPAKVNLYLHVTGRRADGYHLLDSLVAFADIADVVTAEPADDLSLSYDGPFAGDLPNIGTDNLVLRAAHALRVAFAVNAGARMTLSKNLPVASGIGGGSADAAATLRLLAGLWGLDLGDPRVASLALSLGADIPVCLLGKPALMRGIGEDLTPAGPLPALGIVLVNPGVGVSTPAVFKARQGAFSAPADWPLRIGNAEALLAALALTGNDLEAPACGCAPVIAEVLRSLRAVDGVRLARMSGSGATCFALTDGAAEAAAVAQAIRKRQPAWWTAASTLR